MALSGLVIPLLTSHFGWRVGLAFVVCLAVIVGFWSAFIKNRRTVPINSKMNLFLWSTWLTV